ncbi:WD40 repeat containing protein [Pseudoloma neurophilia]|uniref:WD40 repeat containing protein n=1 Tax=Pseudoloma neurophilia TaxID=146866 RepID=A0A0R0LX18_9MICR|nr:WD40 repeat containing protein [Pseudoloma neurophilia]
MFYALRTIKEPTKPISSAEVILRKQSCLAISFGKIVKFYVIENKKLKLIDSIFPGAYIIEIVSLKDKQYLLVSNDLQFVVMKDLKAIKKGRISQENIVSKRQLLKKCVSNQEYVVFLFKNNKLTILNFSGSHLKINDNIKDLIAYDVVDIVLDKNIVCCLAIHFDGRTYIIRYSIDEGNREFVFKNRKLLKDIERIFFSNGNLYVWRGSQMTVFDKNDKMTEIYMANNYILSTLALEDGGLLMAMYDGEIHRIKDNSSEIIATIDIRFDRMSFFQNYIFAHARFGKSCLLLYEQGKISTVDLDFIQSHSKMKKITFKNGMKFLSTDQEKHNKGKLTYRIPTAKKQILDGLAIIKKFWVFDQQIFVSYPGYSIIFKFGVFLRKMDEILNFKAFNDTCIFHTANTITVMAQTTRSTEFPGMILSEILKDEIIVYTDTKRLFVIDLNTFKTIHKVRVVHEVANIKVFDTTIMISLFSGQLKFLNRKLEHLKTIDSKIITHCDFLDDKSLIFSDFSDRVYYLSLKTIVPQKLFVSKGLIGLAKFDDDIYTFGKECVRINGHLDCHMLKVKNVQHLTHYQDTFYISKKNKIFSLNIEKEPKISINISETIVKAFDYCESAKVHALAYTNDDEDSTIQLKSVMTNSKDLKKYHKMLYKKEKAKLLGIKETSGNNAVKKPKLIEYSPDISEIPCKPKFTKTINISSIDIEGGAVVSIRFYKNLLVVGINIVNHNREGISKIILFDGLRSVAEKAKIGLMCNLEVYKSHIMTVHGDFVTVYKIQNAKIIEIAQKKANSDVSGLYCHKFRMIVAMSFRYCILFEFDFNYNVILDRGRFYDNISIDAGTFYKKNLIIADSTGSLSVYKDNSNGHEINRTASINLNTSVKTIKQGTLNKRQEKHVYYASCQDGALIAIKPYTSTQLLVIIHRIIHKVGEKMLFNYADTIKNFDKITFKRTGVFLDCDMLINHPDIEKCVEKLYKNKEEVLEMIRELRSIH